MLPRVIESPRIGRYLLADWHPGRQVGKCTLPLPFNWETRGGDMTKAMAMVMRMEPTPTVVIMGQGNHGINYRAEVRALHCSRSLKPQAQRAAGTGPARPGPLWGRLVSISQTAARVPPGRGL